MSFLYDYVLPYYSSHDILVTKRQSRMKNTQEYLRLLIPAKTSNFHLIYVSSNMSERFKEFIKKIAYDSL